MKPVCKPVINIDALPVAEHNVFGDKYESFDVGLSELIGASKLGYSHTIVPPGKRSCPFHNHWQEEELFIILSGHGTYRFGDESYPVRAGDIIAAPTGGREVAHHLINDSDGELRYLSISTKSETEVCEYPDSGKIGVYARRPGNEPGKSERLRLMVREGDAQPDYWEGEA